MTISDSIIAAAKILLATDLNAEFRPGDLRKLCGIAQGSFSPVLKSMTIYPGRSPKVIEQASDIFIPINRGLYKLSEKGKTVVGALNVVSSASVLEFETTDLLKNDYWSQIEQMDSRERVIREIVQRRGQPDFCKRLLSAYGYHCAISNCDARDALEAAHIFPYRGAHSNTTCNGLLLRADLHTLFDLNFIAIEPKSLTVRLSKNLLNTDYAPLHMRPINLPAALNDRPDSNSLEFRWSDFIDLDS